MPETFDLAEWVRNDRARLEAEKAADLEHKRDLPPIEQHATAVEVADLPGGAKRVANAALKAGFEISCTRARGPWTDVNGDFNRVADHVKVAGLHPDGRRLAATWVTKADGDWQFVTAHLGGEIGVHNSKALTRYLTGG